MMNIGYLFLYMILIALIAPLASGIITKLKNALRFRKGPGVFQPYWNLLKYFRKDEVISEDSSWIFRVTPYIVLASTLSAAALISPLFFKNPSSFIGDLLALIFLLSLGRFFLSLSGLDPATTFGGMGSSREMFISSFVEPVVLLSIFAISLSAGGTDLGAISALRAMNTATMIAVLSLFLVVLAETSRLPIDNQETHLELTMVHEAMLLEYSGRSLAALELAAYIKQIIFFLILSAAILPQVSGPLFVLLKVLSLCIIVSVVEVSLAKMRLFRVIDFLSFAGVLSVLAIIALSLGV